MREFFYSGKVPDEVKPYLTDDFLEGMIGTHFAYVPDVVDFCFRSVYFVFRGYRSFIFCEISRRLIMYGMLVVYASVDPFCPSLFL